MKGFKDLQFKENSWNDGVVSRIQFENGYGASIVKSSQSFGGEIGLYELAVLDRDGEIVYDTTITNDVIGWLRPEDVTDVMKKIQEL